MSKDSAVCFSANDNFLEAVGQELANGYGFIPYLGAGISAPAGIPIIRYFLPYLKRCICASLGVTGDDFEREDRVLWDPKRSQWPPFIDPTEASSAKKSDYYEEILQRALTSLKASEKSDPTLKNIRDEINVYRQAAGQMAEWRAALRFLSQIEILERDAEDAIATVRVGPDDFNVIDAAFRAVSLNKRPSLNHRMLASVSTLLRIDLILTTNFDTLIEDAFAESGNPLDVYDIHLHDVLPTAETLRNHRSIIKLHGSRHAIRADYSLDQAPAEPDQRRIVEYLAETRIEFDLKPSQKRPARNHLLIVGVAGKEFRTLQYLQRAAEHLNGLKVFWICYSEADQKLLESLQKQLPDVTIVSLVNNEFGLLLLHLYQRIRKSIPANGGLFPSVSRLSLPPLDTYQGTIASPTDKHFLQQLEQAHMQREKVTLATAKKNVYGVTVLTARHFRRTQSGTVSLWMELNDIENVTKVWPLGIAKSMTPQVSPLFSSKFANT